MQKSCDFGGRRLMLRLSVREMRFRPVRLSAQRHCQLALPEKVSSAKSRMHTGSRQIPSV